MGCSTAIKYRAHASYAREGNTHCLSACDIGVCGELIPTSTGHEADQYWSRRGVVLVTHADPYCFDW